MEENKKQFNWKTFIIVLMAVLLAFALYKIATLSDEIDHLKSRNSNLTGDIQILREEINSIYDNVDKQLKKQASLISGVDFSIGNPSEDMKTVELSLTVVPKLISDDMQISVTVDVIAEDSLGYIHKTLAHYWLEREDGSQAETVFGGEMIYDKDGNLLYGDKELWG